MALAEMEAVSSEFDFYGIPLPLPAGTAAAVSGGIIASGSSDKTIKLWDAESAGCVATLEGHEDDVHFVALSGSDITSASSDNSCRVWDRQALACTAVVSVRPLNTGSNYSVCCAALGESGLVGFGFLDGALEVWACLNQPSTTTPIIVQLAGHTKNVLGMAALGSRFISGSADATVKVWDPAAAACLATLSGHTAEIRAVAAAGGCIASASYDLTVRVWDAQTAALTCTLAGHARVVWGPPSAAGMREARVASASADKTVRVWDPRAGDCVATLAGHTDWAAQVVFAPNGRDVISGSWDATLKIWDLRASAACMATLAGHTGEVLALAI